MKNKSVPKDTPKYLRKALERAIKEYQAGVVLEKSALDNFAEKYVTEGSHVSHQSIFCKRKPNK